MPNKQNKQSNGERLCSGSYWYFKTFENYWLWTEGEQTLHLQKLLQTTTGRFFRLARQAPNMNMKQRVSHEKKSQIIDQINI